MKLIDFFGGLEKLLQQRGGQFLVGNTLTWADIQVFLLVIFKKEKNWWMGRTKKARALFWSKIENSKNRRKKKLNKIRKFIFKKRKLKVKRPYEHVFKLLGVLFVGPDNGDGCASSTGKLPGPRRSHGRSRAYSPS